MLVLKRKVGEKVMIGHDVEVQVLDVEGETVKLGFVAPTYVPIMRAELYDDIRKENVQASGHKWTPDQIRRLTSGVSGENDVGKEESTMQTRLDTAMLANWNTIVSAWPAREPPHPAVANPPSASSGAVSSLPTGQTDLAEAKMPGLFGVLAAEQQEQWTKVIEQANESLKAVDRALRVRYDEKTNQIYVEVINLVTQEVESSHPPEFLLELAAKLKELIGWFIDKKL